MENQKRLIITNNPSVNELFKNSILYNESYSYMDVLLCARDHIHMGRKLLTHPLSGSVKPDETPYKTVIVSEEINDLDIDGLMIIENAIQTADKFLKNRKHFILSERVLKDFQLIDLDLVFNHNSERV